MPYPYASHLIPEIVRAPKCLREGETLEPKAKGPRGSSFGVNLDLIDGRYTDLRYLGNTHDVADPSGYSASLLLGGERVRGVDYHAVGQRLRYRERIPAGWHQDIRDPNLATTDANQHRREALPDFAPSDFKDFIGKTAQMWNIDLGWEASML